MAPLTTGAIQALLREFSQQRAGRGRYVSGGGTGLTANGGVISDYTDPGSGNIYRAHIFTSSGTFTVSSIGGYGSNVDYLVVAGGGGGANPSMGSNRVAGSGAGGFITGPTPVSATSYPISVGAGGAGNGPVSNNGANTTAFSQTAFGGGGAGRDDPAPPSNGFPGGSGGGGWYISGGSGGAGYNYPGPTQQGYPGSPGFNSPEYGGGGGGAGGAGQRRFGGAGAANVYAYGPTNPVTYAAGGESSDYPSTDRTANGTFSTGNGGSGRGSGGSGIVVVRYQIAQLTATAKATGGAISYYGGKTIHTFTSSGTFASLPTWSPGTSVEYVVVAGGGGAGAGTGGGGGAGGYLTGSTPFSGPFSFAVSVGAGGIGGNPASPSVIKGNQGTNSSSAFPTGTITATYGGYGGAGGFQDPTNYGGPGGSGGGGGNGGTPGIPPVAPDGTTNGGSGTAGPPRQGYDGGKGMNNSTRHGGGGGGAGGIGGDGTTSLSGTGGTGVQLPTTFRNPVSTVGTPGPGPSIYWVAGGGAGGAADTNTSPGGAGGGGPSAGSTSGANNALENTGGGGGGNNPAITPGYGGNGGSGIVIIAYPS